MPVGAKTRTVDEHRSFRHSTELRDEALRISDVREDAEADGGVEGSLLKRQIVQLAHGETQPLRVEVRSQQLAARRSAPQYVHPVSGLHQSGCELRVSAAYVQQLRR
jgi:hypothetical protein